MTATDPERLRVLETMIGPETLEDIQRLLDDLWSACDIPELVQIHTDLAAGEIGANIVEHAANGSPTRLRMEVQKSSEALRIHFTDDGRAAPVDLSRVAMPPAMSERGRGLAIAIHVLDELSYHRDNDGNHWTLVHRLDPQ